MLLSKKRQRSCSTFEESQKKKNDIKYIIYNSNGDWGLGIGDWGLGIGDWADFIDKFSEKYAKFTEPNLNFIKLISEVFI